MLSESSKSWATTVKRHLKNSETSAGPKENDLENQKVLADSDNLHEWSQKSCGEHKTINSTNSDSDNNSKNYYSPRSSDSNLNNNYVQTSNRRYPNDHQNFQKPKGHQIRLLIPEKAAGAVIGVQGKNIKRLRSEFYDDCSITLPDTDCFYERVLIINSFNEQSQGSKNVTLDCLEKIQKLISFDIEAARLTEHQIFRSNKKEVHGE